MTPRLFGDAPWLFGARVDTIVFGGSALLSLALLILGDQLHIDEGDAPVWIWLSCVVAIDVAHVWSTLFRVHLDPAEWRLRPGLLVATPLLAYGAGVAAHLHSPLTFWRVLAYAAVFHFVRQQVGWVGLYRRRAGETDDIDRRLDTAAIHACTLFPLLWWHAHLPREFHWMLPGDFVSGVPTWLAYRLEPVYWAIMIAFCIRQVILARGGRAVNTGKVVVVLTTWACWHVGMITYDSDYAFTVTNVIIHGVPYMALTYRHARVRAAERAGGGVRLVGGGIGLFLALLLTLALLEESLWDRLVWHDHEALFGRAAKLDAAALSFIVPILAVPQAVHYVLDGFIWRVRPENPVLARELAPPASAHTSPLT